MMMTGHVMRLHLERPTEKTERTANQGKHGTHQNTTYLRQLDNVVTTHAGDSRVNEARFPLPELTARVDG